MKKIVIMFLVMISRVFAVVPTTDVTQAAQDQSTMASYTAQVSNTINKITIASNAAEQVHNLQGLQKLQGGITLCQLCNASSLSELQAYQQSVNTDLCSQFSKAYTNITGISTSAQSLNQIMSLLSTNPKAALLALQQAAITATTTTNNTLGQMQMLQAQAVQKQLADEKVSAQTNTAVVDGISNVQY
jgi:hypothetical protein